MNSGKRKTIIMIGAGGHARTVMNIVKRMGDCVIKGVVDPRYSVGEEIAGCPVLGNDDILENDCMKGLFLSIGVGMMEGNDIRKNIYDKFRNLGYEFALIMDPCAIVADDAVISDGVQIMPGVIIHPGSHIGRNSIINTSAVVEHDCIIGDHSHIGPGSIIGGGVMVGECSLVGLGACVLPGVKIGKRVTVGAGTVVTRDVEDGRTIKGVPAK